ncbi:hypothetical protein DFI_07470 [Deinococcus ficus]|uniref:Uncharacterized protein n=1 Tax=Deinococcus ficus TaxID=317577 RepID=A0A221SW48_9DEIO|nr:hypothetical protein DFI_07470 [Deinococcus ficus]
MGAPDAFPGLAARARAGRPGGRAGRPDAGGFRVTGLRRAPVAAVAGQPGGDHQRVAGRAEHHGLPPRPHPGGPDLRGAGTGGVHQTPRLTAFRGVLRPARQVNAGSGGSHGPWYD